MRSVCTAPPSPPSSHPAHQASSPKYSPLGGWLMSCTNFFVSLSSSSSGGWLKGTYSENQGVAGRPTVSDIITYP